MTELYALFRGMYPYFALPAIAVIVWRIRRHLWTRAETVILGAIVLHALLLILQVALADHKLYVSRRYLLPAAALGFGWTAWGAMEVYRHLSRQFRILALVAGAVLALFLLWDGMVPGIKERYGAAKASKRAVEAAAVAAIRAEWPQPQPPGEKVWNPDHYLPRRRPVIASPLRGIGARAGGRDYQFFIAGDGSRVDGWLLPAGSRIPAAAEPVRRFEAGGQSWILLRRK